MAVDLRKCCLILLIAHDASTIRTVMSQNSVDILLFNLMFSSLENIILSSWPGTKMWGSWEIGLFNHIREFTF